MTPTPPPPIVTDPVSREIEGRLHAAVAAVGQATAETLRWFEAPGLAVSEKADRSPVTQADLAAEAILRRELLAAFPGDAFLGEESGTVVGTTGFEWIVDPIDGTKSFIRGVPLHATLVGCRRDGAGVVGVVAIPALGEMVYAAAGGGAWHCSGRRPPVRARVSSRPTLAGSLLCTSDFTSFARRQDGGDEIRRNLEQACLLCRTWGDGYGYLLVATGRAEVMIDPQMSPWDAAAVETVVTEAGGAFTDWQGRRRIDSGEGLATNGLVHAETLRIIGGGG